MKRHESLRWQRRISGSLQLFYVLYMDGMVNRSKIEQDVILHVENKKKKKDSVQYFVIRGFIFEIIDFEDLTSILKFS